LTLLIRGKLQRFKQSKYFVLCILYFVLRCDFVLALENGLVSDGEMFKVQRSKYKARSTKHKAQLVCYHGALI
jgi:hypothetical protein